MTYEDAIRVLLRGVCGENPHDIARETGLTRVAIRGFISGESKTRRESHVAEPQPDGTILLRLESMNTESVVK